MHSMERLADLGAFVDTPSGKTALTAGSTAPNANTAKLCPHRWEVWIEGSSCCGARGPQLSTHKRRSEIKWRPTPHGRQGQLSLASKPSRRKEQQQGGQSGKPTWAGLQYTTATHQPPPPNSNARPSQPKGQSLRPSPPQYTPAQALCCPLWARAWCRRIT